MNRMNTLNFIRENLLSPKDIVITTHFKPDGDALGSALALFHWLKEKGHNVQVIVPSDFPYFLDWLPGREEVVIYDPENENMNRRIQQAEWLFCLDFNHLSRLMAMSQVISDAKGMKIMIDHHLEPSGFDDVRFWDSGAAATAQIVYKFIAKKMQDQQHINKDIATCLYTGIMTDTGSFRFRSTTSEVHRIIANLIDKNIENWQIHEHIYNSNSEKRLRFLGHVLLHRLEVLSEYNTAIMRIDKEDLKNLSIGTEIGRASCKK